MPTSSTAGSTSKKMMWTGRVISILAVLSLLLDSVGKFLMMKPVVDGCIKLGLPLTLLPTIATILLVCTVLYAIPRTSILGAILLTGYFGGAVMINLRVAQPLFSFTLAPIYFGIFVWAGLYLRDERIRALIPLQRR